MSILDISYTGNPDCANSVGWLDVLYTDNPDSANSVD